MGCVTRRKVNSDRNPSTPHKRSSSGWFCCGLRFGWLFGWGRITRLWGGDKQSGKREKKGSWVHSSFSVMNQGLPKADANMDILFQVLSAGASLRGPPSLCPAQQRIRPHRTHIAKSLTRKFLVYGNVSAPAPLHPPSSSSRQRHYH